MGKVAEERTEDVEVVGEEMGEEMEICRVSSCIETEVFHK